MKYFQLMLVVLAALFVIAAGCSKVTVKEVMGPTETVTDTLTQIDVITIVDTLVVIDTLARIDTVTIVDTVTIENGGLDDSDFYHALQQYLRGAYPEYWLYYPAIGDADIIITGSGNTLVMELYMVISTRDWSASDWAYGKFQIIFDGTTFSITDITPESSSLPAVKPGHTRIQLR